MSRIIQSIGAMVPHGDPAALDRRLGQLSEFGFDHAELSITACAVIVGGQLNPVRLRHLTDVIARHDIGITLHAPLILNFMDLVHADLHMSVARACIAFCHAVGAPVLVVHPGWVDPCHLSADRSGLLALERDALSRLAEDAAQRGVTLCLENMPVILESLHGELDNHGIETQSIAAQVRAVDHPALRATIDVSHAHIAATHRGHDLRADLSEMAPVTRHLHLHDSFGRPPTLERANYPEVMAYGMGDLHLPLGWGNIDFEQALVGLPLPPGLSMTLEINRLYDDDQTMVDSLTRARHLQERIQATTGPVAGA
ncbi:sugar phosphate isomerase/epimerase [Magnetospira thiophila]